MSEAIQNRVLAELTRFKVGGEAELFFQPEDTADLRKFLLRRPRELSVHILGLGSNTLVRDGRLVGLVLRLGGPAFCNASADGENIECGAFAPLAVVAKAAAESGAAGFEFMAGIPGTIGGAIISNAGCFGGEMKDVLVSIKALDMDTGEEISIPAEELGLEYRKSKLPPGLIITSASLRGRAGDKAEIQAKMADIHEQKGRAQPVAAKTAGSVFKNPNGAKAWELIQGAGMQGRELGGAQVSPMHANFIVNLGSATAADIEDLAEEVRDAVWARSGIMLEYEIRIIGSRK